MREESQRSVLTGSLVFTAIVGTLGILLFVPAPAQSGELPAAISDQEFWRMVTEFSEPGGVFQQEFMSNEDSAQFVIPALKQSTLPGGVYIGVGPEQNFTYIAAIRPKLAFVIDIRRDNMLEHLMYKALFEISADRADFFSHLFSRKRPPGLETNPSVKALLDAYQEVGPDSGLYEENLRAVMARLINEHKFQLNEADKERVALILNTFYKTGPYTLKGSGDKNMSYAQMMAATDLAGSSHSFLASEENFKAVQELQRQNLIVPLVGDFAGGRTILGLGRYLKERDAVVRVFYVSNVERYLFEQGEHGRQFYSNAAALPVDSSSTFIRSVTVDISRRLGIPIPASPANWRSFLFPMADSLKAFANGRIQTYRELFEVVR